MATRKAPSVTSDWLAAAAHLAGSLPRERFHPAVLAWIETNQHRRGPWGVAFSGGPDSLVLLLLLWAHWPTRRARLHALHFDHGMRGAESRRDAEFCRRVCCALGVRFTAGRWPGRHRHASEAEARTARHAFFRKHARVLWLGHQQDDIAESMLMRLARGSGVGGLAAPRPIQPMPGGRVHLRPLLAVQKTEIVAALRAAAVVWREDASNARGDFFRNRIRHDVLPAWIRAAERDAIAGAARSRELLEEDEAALEAWLGQLAPLAPADGATSRARAPVLELTKLAGQPRALWRRALHRWLGALPVATELSRQAFETLLAAAERATPTRQSLGREGFAVIRSGRLAFQKAGKSLRKFPRRPN
jgi:tRNA(Ile)-lysidine synthase